MMKPFARTSPHALAVAIATAFIPVVAAAQTSSPLEMPSMQVVGSADDAVSRQTGAVVIVTKEEIEHAITACGFPLTVRGETLELADFARLSDVLQNQKNG